MGKNICHLLQNRIKTGTMITKNFFFIYLAWVLGLMKNIFPKVLHNNVKPGTMWLLNGLPNYTAIFLSCFLLKHFFFSPAKYPLQIFKTLDSYIKTLSFSLSLQSYFLFNVFFLYSHFLEVTNSTRHLQVQVIEL